MHSNRVQKKDPNSFGTCFYVQITNLKNQTMVYMCCSCPSRNNHSVRLISTDSILLCEREQAEINFNQKSLNKWMCFPILYFRHAYITNILLIYWHIEYLYHLLSYYLANKWSLHVRSQGLEILMLIRGKKRKTKITHHCHYNKNEP